MDEGWVVQPGELDAAGRGVVAAAEDAHAAVERGLSALRSVAAALPAVLADAAGQPVGEGRAAGAARALAARLEVAGVAWAEAVRAHGEALTATAADTVARDARVASATPRMPGGPAGAGRSAVRATGGPR